MCTRYTIAKMTFLTECAYVGAAARTGAFHFAVKHHTLVSSRSAYQLRTPEVWCLTAKWKCRRRALPSPIKNDSIVN
jgi:hypothetical protein